jgi:uncharacterized protein (TIGR03083 family)
MDTVQIYREEQACIAALVRGADAEQVGRIVPACPRWTLRDLVAHLVGVAADVMDGNLSGVGSEPWTSRHIEARRGRSVQELLAEWETLVEGMDQKIPALPPVFHVSFLADIATHEQDVRGALDRPGARDTEAYARMREAFLFTLNRRVRRAGLPALRLQTEIGVWTAGEGEPAVSVHCSDFELVRALSGRRSLRQIAGFRWEGDSNPYVPLIPNFEPSARDLVEPQ